MKKLKSNTLLLVGSMVDKQFFESFFKEVFLVESNEEALECYYQNSPSIIFFSCSQERVSLLDSVKRIRDDSRETIFVVLSENRDTACLLDLLPYHLLGCIEKPFDMQKVKLVFENISHDLDFFNNNLIFLDKNYSFDRTSRVLYDEEKKDVKLTKHEGALMSILSSNNQYFLSESIEYFIWEEDSTSQDCNNRLKNLLYGLRRKLPSKSIINYYNLGYKLLVK